MHKNISVIDLEIHPDTGAVINIGKKYDLSHTPPGVVLINGSPDIVAFNEWWLDRAIPISRYGVKPFSLNLTSSLAQWMMVNSLCLSLSDHYWIKPEESELTWLDVNFFDNVFSEDLGNIIFEELSETENYDNDIILSRDILNKKVKRIFSPDASTSGNLPKKWKIIDNKRVLFKGSTNPFRQEPLNEILAAHILKKLNIDHVDYSLEYFQNKPLSICETMVNKETELISAYQILLEGKFYGSKSIYDNFLEHCDILNIKDARLFLDKLISFDYLIANEDRHFNNFGALRNADTLEYLGMAPVFDNGNSLWFNRMETDITGGFIPESKPFRKKHEEQIKLVKNFDWLDFEILKELKYDIHDIITKHCYISEQRKYSICEAFEKRAISLERLANASKNDRF
jgi:hypothetical protein